MGRSLAVATGLVGPPIGLVALVVVTLVGVGGFDPPGCVASSGEGVTSVSIMGPPSVTVGQLASWYSASGRADPTSTIGVSISKLAGYYLLYGTVEGVRPEVAFVQAVVETGGFTNDDARRLNNFAGIGHCDTCAQGMTFPTVATGVDAQVQLLHRVVDGNGVHLANPTVAPPWGGRQATDLAGLASNWASSPIYATTLSTTLASVLESAGVQLAPGTALSCASGGFAFPLPRASIRSESWLTKPHQGIAAADVPVPPGTEVYAPVSGIVTAAPVGGECGLGVSIRDGAGDAWTLCHGTDGGDLVHPGQQVAAGELVMHSGFTGHVEPAGPGGAHLHIQILLADGGLACPQFWLDAQWRGANPPPLASLPTTGCIF